MISALKLVLSLVQALYFRFLILCFSSPNLFSSSGDRFLVNCLTQCHAVVL